MNDAALVGLLSELALSRGPGGAPPPWVVAALIAGALRISRRVGPLMALDPQARQIELLWLVIAFGAGWGRKVAAGVPGPDDDPWRFAWARAAQELEQSIFGAISATAEHVRSSLGGQKGCSDGFPREYLQMAAEDVARRFRFGGCLCRGVRPDPDADDGRRVGSRIRAVRCHRGHKLGLWRPELVSFLDFVWQAVKGPRVSETQQFGGGAVLQGMYWWYLYHWHFIRMGAVLKWVCPECGTKVFEGQSCLTCFGKGLLREADRATRRTVDRRLLIPAEFGGPYRLAEYYHCLPCPNYYPADEPACPRCRHPRPSRSRVSHVYLLGTDMLPLDPTLLDQVQAATVPDADSMTEAERNDLFRRLAAALAQLPRDLRKVVHLVFHERGKDLDADIQRAAEALRLSKAATGNLLEVALATLRKRISYGKDDGTSSAGRA